jgi:hypothetical protein
MLDDCENCDGTGMCQVCFDDGAPCSWCRDGACMDCMGTGLGPFRCEEAE